MCDGDVAAAGGELEDGAVFADDRVEARKVSRHSSKIREPPARDENDRDPLLTGRPDGVTHRRIERVPGRYCPVVVDRNGPQFHSVPTCKMSPPIFASTRDVRERLCASESHRRPPNERPVQLYRLCLHRLVVVRSTMTDSVRPFSDAYRAQRPDQSPIDAPERHDVHGCNSRACRPSTIRQLCASLNAEGSRRSQSGVERVSKGHVPRIACQSGPHPTRDVGVPDAGVRIGKAQRTA